jgi:signal transduction histidine kinase
VSSPVLTARSRGSGRRWAPARVDVWLTAGMAVVSVGAVLAFPAEAPYRPVDALALVLVAAAQIGLLWRSRAPLVALGVSGLVIVVSTAAGYSVGSYVLAPWIALFTCFALGGRRLRTVATGVVVLAVAGYLAFDRGVDPAGPEVLSFVIQFLIAAIAGELSRRRARATAAEARRAEEGNQRALAAERLLMQERTRLARELHDSLGHTVNVMVLQAGVGRRVFAANPAYAQEALASIETVGRGALGELDRLLRVLQPDEPGRGAEPFAPTTADLAQLVDRVRATGRVVHLRMNGVELSGSCARTLYRIVQEALTNAVRHTTAGDIRVEVAHDGDRLVIDVLNEGERFDEPAPGRGLVNMRERARLEGGRLEAGPVEGGFRVRAVLPEHSAVGA